MRLPSFTLLLSPLFHLSFVVNGEIITVRLPRSACSASSTTPDSATVAQSTVIVSPTPWTDSAANGGQPFLLEISQVDPSGWYHRRQVQTQSWLMPNGNTTTNCSKAAQYQIVNGQLSTLDGLYASTNYGIRNQAFAVSQDVGPISTSFFVNGTMLGWNNSNFSNGTAQFYKLPPGLLENALILAKFIGPMTPRRGWSPIYIYANPVDSCPYYLSSNSTTPSANNSMTSPPISTMGPTMSGSASGNSTPPTAPSSTWEGSFVSPTALSTNGICGAGSGQNCAGSDFGDCCSKDGYCGGSQAYCSTGCQIAFGTCDPDQYPSGSLTAQSSSSSMSASSIGTTSGMNATPTSTSTPGVANVSTTGTCGPQYGGQTCTGTIFGACCSKNGLCGSTSQYCSADNCDPGYGICSPSATSTSTATALTTVSSSTTSPTAYVDAYGATYQVQGSTNYTGTVINTGRARKRALSERDTEPSFQACLADCDVTPTCMAVTYSGTTCTLFSSVTGSTNAPGFTAGTVQTPASSISSSSMVTMSSSATSSMAFTTPTTSTTGSSSYSMSWSFVVSGSSTTTATDSTIISSASSTSSAISSALASVMQSSSMMTSSSSSSVLIPTTTSTTTSKFSSSSSSAAVILTPTTTTTTTTTSRSSSTIPSSSISSTFSSPAAVQFYTTTTTTTTTSSSAAAVISTLSCPAANGMTYTDSSGVAYVIGCSSDTTASSYTHIAVTTGFNGCFAICDADATCGAWEFVGGVNGTGSGDCYLKHSASTFITAASGYVGGIRVTTGSVSTTKTTTTTSSTPASSASSISSLSPTSSISSVAQVPITTTTTTTRSSTLPTTTTTTTTTSSSAAQVTTTTTTTSSSSTSSSASGGPTPCSFGDPPGTDEDDSYCEIDLPFTMTMYGNSDTKTYASTNGFLSIMQGSSVYQAVALPSSTLPNNTACPFWDDLKLYGASPDQGIFYSFNAAGTTVTYDYLLGRAGVPSEIYHFQIVYSTNAPGVFVYKYISVGSSNNGVDASVGIQGGNGFVQFSLDVADITPGMTITCDTNKSTCVAS